MTMQQREHPLLDKEGKEPTKTSLNITIFCESPTYLGLLDSGDSVGEQQVDCVGEYEMNDGNSRERPSSEKDSFQL